MAWPTAADYQDAIQSPSICFQDPELKVGQPRLNIRGLPQVASGNFASVYTIAGAKIWAVRCFLRNLPGVEKRYDEISKQLRGVQTLSLLPFHFLGDGILILGQWYPIVKMQWSDSKEMSSWVASNLHAPSSLLALSDSLRHEINLLQSHGVAHGDLQHGNVLVTKSGHVELVDYDGMFVPAFAGQPSPELGHVNFQHPKRQPADYDQYLDNFSALVVITSLKALSEQPGLWSKYSTGENLIFTQADFLAPTQSSIFSELIANGSPEVRDLASGLAGCCSYWPLPQESLDTFLGRLSTFAVPASQFRSLPRSKQSATAQPRFTPRAAPPFVWPSFNQRFLAFVAALVMIVIAGAAMRIYLRPNDTPAGENHNGNNGVPPADKLPDPAQLQPPVNPTKTPEQISQATKAPPAVITPHWNLKVYAGEDTLKDGDEFHKRLRTCTLGFVVNYFGPPRTITVEWWVGGEQVYGKDFEAGDRSYESRQAYCNPADSGNYEVKLLIDGKLAQSLSFTIGAPAPAESPELSTRFAFAPATPAGLHVQPWHFILNCELSADGPCIH